MKRSRSTIVTSIALLLVLGGGGCEGRNPGGSHQSPVPLLFDGGSGDCPHPLMPLVAGATWTYEVSSSPTQSPSIAELQVIKLTSKGHAVTAEVRKQIGGRETVVEAVCNSDGVSFLPLFVYLGPMLPAKINYAPQVTKITGALLLPLSKLRPGAEWTHSLQAHTDHPGGKALTLDSMWQVQASYLGEHQVKVPAGTFDTKQIRYSITGHHRPPEEKEVAFTERQSDPPTMAFTYSLAPGIGVVHIVAEPLPDRPGFLPTWSLTKVARPRSGS